MTPTPLPAPTDWLVISDPPSFWVNVAIAVGTIGSVITVLYLAYRARGAERRGARAEEERRREAQALVLTPGPGVRWWISRDHGPAVLIRHAVRMRHKDAPGALPEQKDAEWIVDEKVGKGEPLLGLGIGLRVGDYFEVHWTEQDGSEYSNGVRIVDPNRPHFIANGQNGH